MGRETKFGLLVGLAFIVLFGIILSGRAGSSAEGHATLPTGASDDHRTRALAINRTVDPFEDHTIVMPGPDKAPVPAPPAEEPLPAPERLVSDEAPPARPDDVGTLAFAPAIIKTPAGPEQGDLRDAREMAIAKGGPPPSETASGSKTVHTVRPGDTLTSIARQYYGKAADTEWKRIWEANKTSLRDANRLSAGQKLIIPAPPARPVETAPAPADTPRKDSPRDSGRDTAIVGAGKFGPAPRDRVRDVTAKELERMLGTQGDLVERPAKAPATYTVQPGDTFYSIASKMYGDSRQGRLLYLRNQHLVADERKLKVGQRILLLDGASPVAADSAVAQR